MSFDYGLDGTQATIEDVDISKYLNIQAVLDNPDAIKETYVDGKRTVVFVKKIGRYFAELTQVEEDGKVILHKSLFSQKKEPYAKLNDIRSENSSSEGGTSSISHAAEATPAISLQSRGDDMSDTSVGKDSENPSSSQVKGEKVAGNQGANGVQAALSAAEAETDTEPTEGQKEAGNYKKGHVRIDGYDITIENPKGSVRRGTDADGKQWSVTMNNTYGYIRGTEGVDGDHIDIFLSEDPSNGNVFVIDQVNADGTFDEHKVMYGFASAEEARDNYLANYSEGWTGLGTISEVTKDEFKKWIESSHRKTKPFADYKNVKVEGAQNEAAEGVVTPAEEKTDNQGNPLNEDGTLKLEKITSIDEITDEDFSAPTRSVELPTLSKNVDQAIGANGKPVIIKKNIFERNAERHADLTADDNRNILQSALYNANLYGQNQKATRPYNWVVINTKDKEGNNRLVLIELSPEKENAEIVHWHYIDDKGLNKIKRQAEREDGQLLILPSEGSEEAGALSGPTNDLSSDGKATDNSSNRQVNGVKNGGIEDDVSMAERKGVEDKAKRNATGFAMEQTIPQEREQVSDQGGAQESVGIEDQQVRQQKTGSSASEVTETERTLRDELNNVLTRAGIEVITDVEQGQRVLDEANDKGVRMQAKKKST